MLAAQSLFDYYAQEVFERVAPDLREFLLRAAVVAEMDADTVGALTDSAGRRVSVVKNVQRSSVH